MGFPGSMDLYARTCLRPVCDLVPAGSGVTARPDPLFTGGDGPAGCDHTAMFPPLPRTATARCLSRQIDLMGFRIVICRLGIL